MYGVAQFIARLRDRYMRKDIHRPSHLYLDNTIYFITASTMKRSSAIYCAFEMDDAKLTSFASLLQELVRFYELELIGWVILRNHYHLLLKVAKALSLPNFIKSLHGKSAFQFNKIDKRLGRKVWYQYWDTCIRDDATMYTRLNYMHNNPVKHGYVKELANYKYSSYFSYLEKFGKEWLDDALSKYPVVDYLEGDDF